MNAFPASIGPLESTGQMRMFASVSNLENGQSIPKCLTGCVCDPSKHTGNCAEESGQCECLPQFTGPNCDQCGLKWVGRNGQI